MRQRVSPLTLNVSKALDEAKPSRFHTQVMVTAGLGFFAASYNLFVFPIVSGLLSRQWDPNPPAPGLFGPANVASAITFIGAFAGSVLFGRVADKFGRTRAYGYEAFLMVIGAVGSAGFALAGIGVPLMIARFVLGLGVGGDYPGSAVIMSEFADRENRGKLLGLVFSAQALGIACAYMAGLTLVTVSRDYPADAQGLLLLGALPAAAAAYLRFAMPESPRYLVRVKGQRDHAAKLIKDISGGAIEVTDPGEKKRPIEFLEFIAKPKYRRYLLVTAGAWFLFDYAYYGNALSAPSPYVKVLCPGGRPPLAELCRAAGPASMDTPPGLALALVVFLVAAVPGYYIAAAFVDRMGRKLMQSLGFAIMGVLFLVIALLPLSALPHALLPLFLILFGTSYFFAEFGPNATTFIVPAEIYPTSARATGYGISSGIAKLGAAVGVFVLPGILGGRSGTRNAMLLFAGCAIVGALLTCLIPEGARKTLDKLSQEETLIAPEPGSSPDRDGEVRPRPVGDNPGGGDLRLMPVSHALWRRTVRAGTGKEFWWKCRSPRLGTDRPRSPRAWRRCVPGWRTAAARNGT